MRRLAYSQPSVRWSNVLRSVGVSVFEMVRRARRSCFLIDRSGVVRYVWVSDHPIDPTMRRPPLAEVHDAVLEAFGTEPETFGVE
ncbi:hypothetical protein [Haladaptatus sp. T7]|nr:hypothetical protein [Haladaptatus sp. T7]